MSKLTIPTALSRFDDISSMPNFSINAPIDPTIIYPSYIPSSPVTNIVELRGSKSGVEEHMLTRHGLELKMSSLVF